MSKLIVTGGAGFIGSHLTDRLIADGHEVVVVDSLLLGKKEYVNKKAKFIKADIRDQKKMPKVFAGAEAIFHLAADPRLQVSIENPEITHDINVNGTFNVLKSARAAKVRKVIFTSSCAVYGDQSPPIKENAMPNPLSPYGLHKLIGEQYARVFSSCFGLETVCLRYFNVFGPRKLATGSYPMVIPIFVKQRQEGKPLGIVGDGEATRDYVHVLDVVEANIAAWRSSVKNGQSINIGSGRQVSVNEIAKLIGGEVVHLPARPGEMKYIEADASLAKELLGWESKMDFKEKLDELKVAAGIK